MIDSVTSSKLASLFYFFRSKKLVVSCCKINSDCREDLFLQGQNIKHPLIFAKEFSKFFQFKNF